MTAIELLEFQQKAVTSLVDGAAQYFIDGPDRIGGRDVPYVAQLKAVTGAGKTPILASVIGHVSPSIILWTTKFGSVVDQTVTNLRVGGKYNHLLGGQSVEVMKFTEIPSAAEWRRILAQESGITVLVSTVAAWNSTEKDARLNVHRVSSDWGDWSRWEQLKTGRKRPLWVVYDEAHNSTTEQVEQLDDLDPAGFFVAGASQVKGKLQAYLTNLPDEARKKRIVPIPTRAVVLAELLKSTISLADYDSSSGEMITAVVKKRAALEKALIKRGASVTPKAIYVVETSKSRPIEIWDTLIAQNKVDPATIAICTNTKDLPKAAKRIERLDQLGPDHLHIIFNKKLQEGWDDPSVYVCYFDGKTESATRIQQVIGRAMRQPGAAHFDDEDLNTAFFYINCPSETLESITDELKDELRIYKTEADPDEFEPFQFKEERRSRPRIPVKPSLVGKLHAPILQTEMPKHGVLEAFLHKKAFSFGDADRKAPGRALINVVSVKTGDVKQKKRDLLEDSRIRCGQFLQEQIRMLSRDCLDAMHPDAFVTSELMLTACMKSKALEHYRLVAQEIVSLYENHVQLCESLDPDNTHYVVGAYQPSGSTDKEFSNAGHSRYDAKAFRPDELLMANALDESGYTWVRNKDRLDYGIPLPVKSGGSSRFFPDFLWWVKKTVWAIDPTGKFILDEKVRGKLLLTPEPLRIALVTRTRFDKNFKLIQGDGWTLMRHRPGLVAPETFESLAELIATLEAES